MEIGPFASLRPIILELSSCDDYNIVVALQCFTFLYDLQCMCGQIRNTANGTMHSLRGNKLTS